MLGGTEPVVETPSTCVHARDGPVFRPSPSTITSSTFYYTARSLASAPHAVRRLVIEARPVDEVRYRRYQTTAAVLPTTPMPGTGRVWLTWLLQHRSSALR